jgi:hypothetical protein
LIADNGTSSMSALTLPSTANASVSAMSSRVPTNEPRIVMQFATTSNSGTGNSPGGSPQDTRTALARHADALLEAPNEGAVIRLSS